MAAKGADRGRGRLTDAAYDATDIGSGADSDLANGTCRAVYVGGAGDVKVTLLGGTSVTFKAVPVGTVLPVQAKRVWATGSTATLMLALY